MLGRGNTVVLLSIVLAFSSVDSFAPPACKTTTLFSNRIAPCQASVNGEEAFSAQKLAAAAFIALSIFAGPGAGYADGSTEKFKLPPIDFADQNRCQLRSSNMGQANAARDKLYDLRMCKLSGAKAVGYDLSGVIMTNTDLSNAILRDSYFSKGYLHDSNFDGADFSNGIVDRASFKGSSLKGTIFTNAVLTGTSFEGANVEGADFSDAYIGGFDIRSLCRNPTLKGENPVTGVDTRTSVGCT